MVLFTYRSFVALHLCHTLCRTVWLSVVKGVRSALWWSRRVRNPSVWVLSCITNIFSEAVVCSFLIWRISFIYELRATSMLAFLFLRELLLLSSPQSKSLVSQLNKKHIKVWGIQTLMPSSLLLIMTLRVGNARLMGVSAPVGVAEWCLFFYNLPPWINILIDPLCTSICSLFEW